MDKSEHRIEFKRPSWIEYYIGLAFAVSQKSHDAQTKHGCIITDRQNRILSTGYNGFPRGIDDSLPPNIRPHKNDWFAGSHSELNAILNSNVKINDGIAYVTGHCCNRCIVALWQAGVTEVYMYDKIGTLQESHGPTDEWFNQFVEATGIKVHFVKPDMSWLKGIANDLPGEVEEEKEKFETMLKEDSCKMKYELPYSCESGWQVFFVGNYELNFVGTKEDATSLDQILNRSKISISPQEIHSH